MAKGKRSRKRGRPAGKPLNAQELRARRANLAKARLAPQEAIYRLTAKRLAACLKNLRKAVAARRRREGSERVRLNALRHGVYSRELVDESVERLGESPREFAEHRELFARMLVPCNEDEAVIIWELSNLAWRRLRLFRAAAERERRDLRRLLGRYPPPRALAAEETLNRMYMLFATLDDCDRVVGEASKLRVEMQEYFRMLIARRAPVEAEENLGRARWTPPEKYSAQDASLDLAPDDAPPEGSLLETAQAQVPAESPARLRGADDPSVDSEIGSEGN